MSKKGLIKALINILILAFSSGSLWAGEISDWLERTKTKGDINLFFQAQDTEKALFPSRDQGIVRLRAGLEFIINDQWNVGIGFASVGHDPGSTYFTLNDTLDSISRRLDDTYNLDMNNERPSFIAGDFKDPIYRAQGLIWDRDIKSDGIAATINFKPLNNLDLEVFVTPAYFFPDEFANRKYNPSMVVFQPGVIWKIDKTSSLKFALTYYMYDNVRGGRFTHNNLSDDDDGWNMINDNDLFAMDAEFSYDLSAMARNKLTDMVPYAAIFGQFISSDLYNIDQGVLMGLKLGNEKVEERGQWQFIYNYRKLERDGWLDFLPDSEFYMGDTALMGSEYEFKIGVNKNIALGLDYYSKPFKGNPGQTEYLLQADLVFKF
jgi:hypothetical protein